MLKVHEQFNPALKTTVPPGGVVPFWTLNGAERMVLVVGGQGKGKKKTSSSVPFNYKKSDNVVLQFDDNSEVSCVCMCLGMDVHMYVSMCTCMSAYVYVMYIHMCVRALIVRMYVCVCVRI